MSIHPDHGNHDGTNNETLWNTIYYYWLEGQGLLVSSVVILILIFTREKFNSEGGQIGQSFMLVIISTILSHLALKFLSPPSAKPKLDEQAAIFNNKHTYIMTFLYTMSFGSFIGFSGAFPKLITDIFGYISAEGCYYQREDYRPYGNGSDGDIDFSFDSIWVDKNDDSRIFVKGGTEYDCIANGGEQWGFETVTNPNAPNVFAFSWLGACIGSLIRPVGGILADRHGGAKVTQILIVWCTVAIICLAVLIQKTAELDQPELNFGLFVFLFLNVFFCLGAMNGTTFRTIAVLFDPQLAGTVLGWSSSIAAYGAFVIPSLFGVAIRVGKTENILYSLAAYYVVCAWINYWYYGRPKAERLGV